MATIEKVENSKEQKTIFAWLGEAVSNPENLRLAFPVILFGSASVVIKYFGHAMAY